MKKEKLCSLLASTFLWTVASLSSVDAVIAGVGTQPGRLISFQKEVKPIFERNCIHCHSSEVSQSGLDLETVEALLKGGHRHGPAVVAGKSSISPLILCLTEKVQPLMPISGDPLPREEIALIARWIDQMTTKGQEEKSSQGAALNSGETAAQQEAASQKADQAGTQTYRWPWTKLERPDVPAVKQKNWVNNPIDALVLAKLEEKELKPAPQASRRALLRRIYFGLIGLPPTPEEMSQFLENTSSDAYDKEIEKLLADERYGERWARHWLDLVRYADTRGGAIDYPRPHMWRYRDYVIRAFNQDRPYDRFVKEQLAGDAFPAYGAEGRLGLAFLAQWVQIERDSSELTRRDYLIDVVDTTGAVFLGMTLGCARCHDHKFDPILQKDYYRMEAFFSPMSVEAKELPFHQYEMPRLQPERWKKQAEEWKQVLAARKREAAEFRATLKEREAAHHVIGVSQDLKDWAREDLRIASIPKDAIYSQEEKHRLESIKRQEARFANPNTPDYYLGRAYMVSDSNLQHTIATYLLNGGFYKSRGEEVKPGFLSATTGGERLSSGPKYGDRFFSKVSDPVKLEGLVGSRRQLLAKWIASSENPLTARVMVNRIWQYHFGKALVPTSSDFGNRGLGAVHQDLLDWLAWEFIESGWSVKTMHRLILKSKVYQQSMKNPSWTENEKIDPDNRYLWVRDPLRLEAEVIRDSILAVSGQLNPVMGGPPFFPEADDDLMARAGTWWEPSRQEERRRRSVYMLQIRSFQLPMMTVFDGPNMDQTTPVRGVTTVTPQVFALFNSKFVHEQARAMVDRILNEVGSDLERQVDRAYRLVFQQAPSPSEMADCLAFLAPPEEVHKSRLSLRQIGLRDSGEQARPSGWGRERGSLFDLCLILLNTNEFIFLE